MTSTGGVEKESGFYPERGRLWSLRTSLQIHEHPQFVHIQHESIALNYVSNIRWIVFLNHHVRKHGSNAWNYLFSHNFSESPINYHIKRTKTLVEGYARCITENITKSWLRQTLVVERGIAVSYKYNPLASVPVPEICVPVLCSRAQKVAVIVIKRKCRLIPDLPAPVAQLFVR